MGLNRSEKVKAHEQQAMKNAVLDTKDEHIGSEAPMRVVACAGDPGITETFFFDILSRFIICMKEPVSYVPTNKNKERQFFLVKRPRHLWVDASGAPDLPKANKHAGTRRKDYLGNINIGHPNGYSIDTIPQMDTEYTIGQPIVARKIAPEYATESNIFVSAFANTDFSNYIQNINRVRSAGTRVGETGIGGNELHDVMSWSDDYWTSHGGGLSKEQLASAGRGGIEYHQLKPLMPAAPRYGGPINPARQMDMEMAAGYQDIGLNVKNNSGAIVSQPGARTIGSPGGNSFWLVLHYYRIDGFMREVHPAYSGTIESLQVGKHRFQNDGITKNLTTGVEQLGKNIFKMGTQTILEKQSDGSTVQHKTVTGDMRFINKNIAFSFAEWEDTNQGNKQRISRDECMPLVIASPNNFPIPKERKLGAIVYSPSYATVVAAQDAAGGGS